MARVGVAISGGGYRATTWGLGALMYLVDAGKHAEVTSISSVSGGSVANGIVAQQTAFRTTDPERFRSALGPVLRHMASDGLIFFGRATNPYVYTVLAGAALTGVGVLALAVAIVIAALDVFGVVSASWAGALVGWSVFAVAVLGTLTFLLFRWRSRVVERAMRKAFFSVGGKSTRLSDLPQPSTNADVPLHVFCSTELQQGQQLYATPEFVYTWAYGQGTPGEMTLARAVQCSACLPGGFAPRFLKTAGHGFSKPNVPKRMVLSDGGVYDNMADQWETGRSNRPLADDGRLGPADQLIVVNSSAAATQEAKKLRLLGAELFGLMRPINVMYDITTKLRRFELVKDWREAARSGTGQQGTLVHIPQSPFTVPQRLTTEGTPDQQARAAAVLSKIPGTREDWQRIAVEDTGVKTTLGKLGVDTVAQLLYHSYVLAMINCHVVLGYPLLPFPSKDDMRRLAS